MFFSRFLKRRAVLRKFRELCAEHSAELATLVKVPAPEAPAKRAELMERRVFLNGYATAMQHAGIVRADILEYKFPPIQPQ